MEQKSALLAVLCSTLDVFFEYYFLESGPWRETTEGGEGREGKARSDSGSLLLTPTVETEEEKKEGKIAHSDLFSHHAGSCFLSFLPHLCIALLDTKYGGKKIKSSPSACN